MSRSNKQASFPSNYVPEDKRRYIGKDKPKVQYTYVPQGLPVSVHPESIIMEERDFNTSFEMDWSPIHEDEPR